MILGIIIAMVFCSVMYTGQGEAPRVPIDYGPFVHVHLMLRGYHIHHWIVSWCIGTMAIYLNWDANIIAFCAYLVLHGLSYTDRFEL